MSKRLERSLALLGILIIFGSLTLFFWNFVRDTIVIPIYYLIWVAGLLLMSLPQAVFLAVLVCIGIFIGLNTLGRMQVKSAPSRRESLAALGRSRYQSWMRLCLGLPLNSLNRTDFVREARHLVLAVLSFQEGMDLDQVEQLVANRSLLVPEAVRRLILSDEILVSESRVNWLGKLVAKFRRWFHRGLSQKDPAMEQQVIEIIHFLEYRLEMNHER